MEELGQSICGTVEEIAKRIADAELAKKIADEELAKQLSDKAREAEKPPPAPVQPQEKPPTQESAEADDCVHPEQLALYEQVLAEHEQHKALFAKMLTDVNLKKFRFDCQKAVNTPVNAISPASASHLQDKLDRLRNLLQGRSIVIDERSFSASQHPGGIEYCLELLSKKLVNQVSSFYTFTFSVRCSVDEQAGRTGTGAARRLETAVLLSTVLGRGSSGPDGHWRRVAFRDCRTSTSRTRWPHCNQCAGHNYLTKILK